MSRDCTSVQLPQLSDSGDVLRVCQADVGICPLILSHLYGMRTVDDCPIITVTIISDRHFDHSTYYK